MNIIFLDVDGVLISTEALIAKRATGRRFCPLLCANLDHILESVPGTKIVISSTWRLRNLGKINRKFREAKCKARMFSSTPVITGWNRRGVEIQAWLDANPGVVEKFVIIDDDSDMEHLIDRLVKVSAKTGLTRKAAERAIKLLS